VLHPQREAEARVDLRVEADAGEVAAAIELRQLLRRLQKQRQVLHLRVLQRYARLLERLRVDDQRDLVRELGQAVELALPGQGLDRARAVLLDQRLADARVDGLQHALGGV